MRPDVVSETIHDTLCWPGALMFERLPFEQRERAEDPIVRSLSALDEHVLTAELSKAFSELTWALEAVGSYDTAAELDAAQGYLVRSANSVPGRSARPLKVNTLRNNPADSSGKLVALVNISASGLPRSSGNVSETIAGRRQICRGFADRRTINAAWSGSGSTHVSSSGRRAVLAGRLWQ
jgi:hypothetical protein